MTSQNKKKKARNSYFFSGADKTDIKMKRRLYYTKRQRNKIKSETRSNMKDESKLFNVMIDGILD